MECPDLGSCVLTRKRLQRAGVRLITIDRPGYGRSSPHPGRTLLDWVADYVEWTGLVGLSPCPIVGWSRGGPYTLACAARNPDLVTSVVLAASSASDDVPSEWDGLPDEVRDLITQLRSGAPGAVDGIESRCQWFATDWAAIFDPGTGTADDALLAEPGVLEPLLAQMREAARQGSIGYVEDWIADALPWGFSPSEVAHDVHVWWGDDDQLVARDCADYLAGAISGSTLTVLANEGHMFPIRHWGEMLAALHGP